MSLKSKTISGVKWSTVSTITLAIVGLLKISVFARFLDAEDFGLMALVTFVLGFMNLFMDMGLTSAILHKQKISNDEYASLYWINIIFSFILFALITSLSPLISNFYEEPDLIELIPLMAISIMLSGLGRQFKTIEQKHLNFKYIAITDIIGAVLGLGVGVVTAVQGYGVYALVYAALTQYAISNTIYFINGVKDRGMIFHFKYQETKPFLRIGIYQVGGQVVNYFNRDLDILIIGKFFSPELLGSYSLAKQLVMRPRQIINPIVIRVASPTLAKVQGDIFRLKKDFLKLINIISTINIPIYIGIIILAPWVVEVFYGRGFEGIITLVRILSVYLMIRSIMSPVGSLVVATGRTDLDFYLNIITLLVTPIFVLIGAQYGLFEAALGLTLSMIILFIPGWRFLIFKLTNASLSEYLKAIFRIDIKGFVKSLSS